MWSPSAKKMTTGQPRRWTRPRQTPRRRSPARYRRCRLGDHDRAATASRRFFGLAPDRTTRAQSLRRREAVDGPHPLGVGAEAPTPKWMGAIDGFSAPKALGAGVVLSGANPKNLLLAVAAAVVIAQTGISGTEQAISYAVFALVGTIGVLSRRHLLRTRGPRRRDPRAVEDLDGSAQRRHHGRAPPGHRGQADRERDQRLQRLSPKVASAWIARRTNRRPPPRELSDAGRARQGRLHARAL